MNTLTWPVAAIVMTIVLATTALGIMHVITAEWIERTFTALLGVLFGGGLGYAIGIFRGRVPIAAAGARVSNHDLGGPE